PTPLCQRSKQFEFALLGLFFSCPQTRYLPRYSKLVSGADAFCAAEGNMPKSANASAWASRRGQRGWHARTLLVREPRGLRVGRSFYRVDGPRREGQRP